MIGTRRLIVRTLLASFVATAGLSFSAGCTDSGKSDGQIQAAPEANQAAQAISKSYGEQMKAKYATKKK